MGALTLAPLATVSATPGVGDPGPIVSGLLDTGCQPGYADPITWTDYTGVPLNGAYWSEGELQGAGPTYNASVWTYNHNVGDRCIAGVSYKLEEGPENECPAPGSDNDPLASQSIFLPEGTYWQDGDLYLQATSQNATVTGQNNDVGNGCAPTATYDSGEAYQDDRCLTCRCGCPIGPPQGRSPLLP